MPRFYPQNLKHLQQYHRPDREQTENGKISIFRCVIICPSACPKFPFRNSTSIGIIAKVDRYRKVFLQNLTDRNIVPSGQIWQRHNTPLFTVQRSATADPEYIRNSLGIPFQNFFNRNSKVLNTGSRRFHISGTVNCFFNH